MAVEWKYSLLNFIYKQSLAESVEYDASPDEVSCTGKTDIKFNLALFLCILTVAFFF